MKKKPLSIILSLVMVLAMIPAVAYGDDKAVIEADGFAVMGYTVLGEGVENSYNVKYDPSKQCILTGIVILEEDMETARYIIEGKTALQKVSDTKIKVSVSADTIKQLYEGKLKDSKGNVIPAQNTFLLYAGIFDGTDASLEDDAIAKCPQILGIVKGIQDVSKIRWNYSKPLVYNGKTQSIKLENVPSKVKVSVAGNKAKKVGTYYAETTGIETTDEDYPISGYMTLEKTWKIVPAASSISKLTAGKKKLTVKMNAKPSAKGASTYQIKYKQKGTSKWKTTTTTSQSKSIKKLKKGKTYYVKVRAYKKIDGKTYYGAWSKTKLSKKVK